MGYGAAATTLPKPTDNLCIAFPWLVGGAFTLIYGYALLACFHINTIHSCLFLKTWRIFWILRASQKLQRMNLSNWYICRLIGCYFLVEVVSCFGFVCLSEFVFFDAWKVFLIIWTLVEPPIAKLVDVIDDQQQLQCTSKNYSVFWIVFLGYKVAHMLEY